MVMDGVQEWGSFTRTAGRRPISEQSLTLSPLDVVAHWGRCGMSADFMASYLAYDFENAAGAQNVISTVLNELVENIVKFSSDQRVAVTASLVHYGEFVCITTENVTNAARATELAFTMEQLVSQDLDELFSALVERNVATKEAISKLGLLTLIKDYNAQLAVRISPRPGSDLSNVLVQVSLDVDGIEDVDVPEPVQSSAKDRWLEAIMARDSKSSRG
jgi:hypothetical protein